LWEGFWRAGASGGGARLESGPMGPGRPASNWALFLGPGIRKKKKQLETCLNRAACGGLGAHPIGEGPGTRFRYRRGRLCQRLATDKKPAGHDSRDEVPISSLGRGPLGRLKAFTPQAGCSGTRTFMGGARWFGWSHFGGSNHSRSGTIQGQGAKGAGVPKPIYERLMGGAKTPRPVARCLHGHGKGPNTLDGGWWPNARPQPGSAQASRRIPASPGPFAGPGTIICGKFLR